jgi:hypothetical protein
MSTRPVPSIVTAPADAGNRPTRDVRGSEPDEQEAGSLASWTQATDRRWRFAARTQMASIPTASRGPCQRSLYAASDRIRGRRLP